MHQSVIDVPMREIHQMSLPKETMMIFLSSGFWMVGGYKYPAYIGLWFSYVVMPSVPASPCGCNLLFKLKS